MNDYRDDFLIIQNRPDRWAPIVMTREPKLVKVGTWFFGLFSVWKLAFGPWKGRDI